MIMALTGGSIIGIAVSIMLLYNGRVTGISGIIGSLFRPEQGQTLWRVLFILGLLSGGIVMRMFNPGFFLQNTTGSLVDYIIAGVLVGFGTLLGNGCTSGHGVCGISRMSVRSIISTITFIGFGVIGVLVFKWLRGAL